METRDDADGVVDDVNALLKLGVGDPYRLEHIKQAFLQNKTLWVTDENYLQHMKKKYLTTVQSDKDEKTKEDADDNSTDKKKIHCWKCGKKSPPEGNFCMACGAALFEVGEGKDRESEGNPQSNKSKTVPVNSRVLILIGIPVLAILLIAGAYSQGMFDNAFEKDRQKEPARQPISNAISDEIMGTHSKCGAGTVLDPETNSCILESEISLGSAAGKHSKCGAGTVLDPETNSCILER